MISKFVTYLLFNIFPKIFFPPTRPLQQYQAFKSFKTIPFNKNSNELYCPCFILICRSNQQLIFFFLHISIYLQQHMFEAQIAYSCWWQLHEIQNNKIIVFFMNDICSSWNKHPYSIIYSDILVHSFSLLETILLFTAQRYWA